SARGRGSRTPVAACPWKRPRSRAEGPRPRRVAAPAPKPETNGSLAAPTMTAPDDLLARLDASVERHRGELRDLALKIHANPGLRFEERRAAAWIAESVERAAGVAVERGVGGLETAVRARAGSGAGPRVAILAEYDALPEIGHACGHNLIAAGAVGVFL